MFFYLTTHTTFFASVSLLRKHVRNSRFSIVVVILKEPHKTYPQFFRDRVRAQKNGAPGRRFRFKLFFRVFLVILSLFFLHFFIHLFGDVFFSSLACHLFLEFFLALLRPFRGEPRFFLLFGPEFLLVSFHSFVRSGLCDLFVRSHHATP